MDGKLVKIKRVIGQTVQFEKRSFNTNAILGHEIMKLPPEADLKALEIAWNAQTLRSGKGYLITSPEVILKSTVEEYILEKDGVRVTKGNNIKKHISTFQEQLDEVKWYG
jgi:hypothetical protein